jgi:hypothetical protein
LLSLLIIAITDPINVVLSGQLLQELPTAIHGPP